MTSAWWTSLSFKTAWEGVKEAIQTNAVGQWNCTKALQSASFCPHSWKAWHVVMWLPNATQRYRKKQKTCITALLQYGLPATFPFQCVFFHGFSSLNPSHPMSTRDPPDHCLAFWVPSSPSPTCHCPTRSLSAILTLCLPTQVQLSGAPTVWCLGSLKISLDI